MKHGVYEVQFMGRPLFEVYIWSQTFQWGYIFSSRSKIEAENVFKQYKGDF